MTKSRRPDVETEMNRSPFVSGLSRRQFLSRDKLMPADIVMTTQRKIARLYLRVPSGDPIRGAIHNRAN